MAYDPGADRPPSPIETRELYDVTRDYLLGYAGALSLGRPTEPRPKDGHRFHADGTQFYGFPFTNDGNTIDVGTYPCATYPPTWSLRFKNLGRLHELVPNASRILGIGDDLEVVHHGPYIKYEGGAIAPQPDARPEPPDCAFVIHGPKMSGMPNLRIRNYRIEPNAYEPQFARGTRSDMLNGARDVMRTPEGMVPLLGFTEWEALRHSIGVLMIMQPESTRRRYGHV